MKNQFFLNGEISKIVAIILYHQIRIIALYRFNFNFINKNHVI